MEAPFSDSMTVSEGQILAEKYRVERVIGVGGMGVVFAAMHLQLGQRVAIKLLKPGAEQHLERFLREARAVVRMRSEHVAKVFDVGTLPTGEPFMVMEYLEGRNLGALLEEHGRFDVEMAVEVVVQACEAVAEAHSLGIVHRDLKPENLFLSGGVGGEPVVKVLDFGISKTTGLLSSPSTQTSSLLGSPMYMAPEQMRSAKSAVVQSDVWALGVVLQELLTQHLPYEAETIPELCIKVMTEPPTSVRALRPELPEGLAQVIDRCLTRSVDERYANAAELATALEPFAPPHARRHAQRARDVMYPMTGERSISRLSAPLAMASVSSLNVLVVDPTSAAPVPNAPAAPAPQGFAPVAPASGSMPVAAVAVADASTKPVAAEAPASAPAQFERLEATTGGPVGKRGAIAVSVLALVVIGFGLGLLRNASQGAVQIESTPSTSASGAATVGVPSSSRPTDITPPTSESSVVAAASSPPPPGSAAAGATASVVAVRPIGADPTAPRQGKPLGAPKAGATAVKGASPQPPPANADEIPSMR